MRRSWAVARLTAGLCLAFFAATSAILVAAYVLVAVHLNERMRTLVTSDLTGLADLYAQRRLPALREAIDTRLARDPAAEAVYLLLDPSGTRLAGNLAIWPIDLPGDGSWSTFHATAGKESVAEFIGAGMVLSDGFRLAVGHATAGNRRVLDRLLGLFVVTGLVFVAISLAGAALLSRWLVRRIVAVNAVAGAVREGNLTARVPGADRPDEFGELAANFNAMLERIARLVAGMREVSDRIAHELRTPLTRLRGQLARLDASAPGSAESVEVRAAIGDEITATVAIFDALLDIATTEAEAGDASRLTSIDLAAIMASVVDLYDAVAQERGIALEVNAAGPAEMLGDRNLLIRMLANVVDNAIKFSPPGGRVAIDLASGGGNHTLSVTDSGPGLSADIRDRAFDRFARGEAAASIPGHGLGLAIVRAIAVRHGIRASLETEGAGLKVVFTCPALGP